MGACPQGRGLQVWLKSEHLPLLPAEVAPPSPGFNSRRPWTPAEGRTKEASVHARKTKGGQHRDPLSEAILEHSKPLREEKRP